MPREVLTLSFRRMDLPEDAEELAEETAPAEGEDGVDGVDEDPGEEGYGDEFEDEPDLGTFRGRAIVFFRKYRRRMATLAFGIFILAVVVEIGGAVPREVDVDYRFPEPGELVEARLMYSQGDEQIREVTLRWESGAPRLVRDTLDLSPGDYVVSALLVDESGDTRLLHGQLSAPADGVVRVRLAE